MIADAGFEVEGAGEVTLPGHRAAGGGCATPCGDHAEAEPAEPSEPAVAAPRTDLVAVRRRGAGTDLAPNA
jgi:biotin synthase